VNWLLDTDVLIDFLRGEPQAQRFMAKVDVAAVSVMTVAELHAGVREGKERHALDTLLGTLQVLPLDGETAAIGGLLRRDWGPSHGVGLPGALIAATVIEHGLTLATLNTKHFPMLKGAQLKLPYKKTVGKATTKHAPR
jgi:predicted nucleic acid-binding protein